MNYEFLNTVKIISGENSLEKIKSELKFLNCKNPLVLSDAMLEKLGVVANVLKYIGKIDKTNIFCDIVTDSSVDLVNSLKRLYDSNKCDGIIAIGGGSVLDTAKALKLVLSQNETNIKNLLGCENIVRNRFIPLLVIPTTSGTGAEATYVAVIRDEKENQKLEFISSEMLPNCCFIDAKMTENLPRNLTASTGVDALCHAIEAYICVQNNPISDAFSTSSIKMICENLIPTVVDGKFKQGREIMANASLLAGIAFSNSMVGLVHAFAHAIGAKCRISHGEAISLCLCEVLKFNMPFCEKRLGDLLLFVADAECYAQTKENDRAKLCIEKLENIIFRLREIGALPKSLSEKGVQKEFLSSLAKSIQNEPAIIYNMRNANNEQILDILNKIY